MENVKGMFSRKYGGVPAWVILLVVAGGVYLYMRHTGSSLFGGSGQGSDPTAGDGSASSVEGQNPEIVFVPAVPGNTSNPNHPNHPAGPPPTHTITVAQRAAAIMADFRKHGKQYFVTHPGALAFLKANAPKDYKIATGKAPAHKPPRHNVGKNPPKQGGNPPRRKTVKR